MEVADQIHRVVDKLKAIADTDPRAKAALNQLFESSRDFSALTDPSPVVRGGLNSPSTSGSQTNAQAPTPWSPEAQDMFATLRDITWRVDALIELHCTAAMDGDDGLKAKCDDEWEVLLQSLEDVRGGLAELKALGERSACLEHWDKVKRKADTMAAAQAITEQTLDARRMLDSIFDYFHQLEEEEDIQLFDQPSTAPTEVSATPTESDAATASSDPTKL